MYLLKEYPTKKDGIGEEFKEAGFYPVIIQNPPASFESFEGWDIHGYGDGECYGYVVDLKNIDEKEAKKGYDYQKYEEFDPNQIITFGKNGKDNDVYIYDATGKVYYAKGCYVEDGVYYSDVLTQDGPIISVEREYDETNNLVNMTITVTPEEDDTNLKLKIDGTEITREDDDTYRYTVTENGTYIVTAEEDKDRISTKKIIVTQIKAATYVITYHFDGVAANQTQIKTDSVEMRLIPPTKVEREGYVLEGFSKNSSATTLDYKVGQIFTENADTDLYAYWKEGVPKEYTITFNANGGQNAPSAIRKTEGEPIQLPLSEIPIRDGYEFKGWSKDSDDATELYAPGSEYAEDGNTVLFAAWEAGEIRVDIQVVPSGAGKAIKTGTVLEGNTIYLSATANVGYTFDRWSLATNSVKVNLADIYSETTRFKMPAGVVSLVANFKETEYDYTIRYNANNGTGAPDTQYKKHDVDIALSSTEPTRSNYAFAGWTDTLSSNTIKYMPGEMYTANKNSTLYAIWTGECIITFDPNGGIVGQTEKIVDISESYGEMPIPTKTGYTFEGWYTEKGSGETSLGDKVESTSIVPKLARQTLYAHWSANNYTIEYNGNENTGGSTATSNHRYDEEKALTTNGFTKTGYTFKNWNTKKDGTGTTYEDNAPVINLTTEPNGIVTLYAQWVANTYTVKYNGNGNDGGTTADSTHTYDVSQALTQNGYTKTGYTFKNWNTNADGTGVTYANNEMVTNLTSTENGTVTLYAQWAANTYTIEYNGNGSTGGVTTNSEHTYNVTKTLTINGYTRTGYSFQNWNTKADGSGTTYSNGEAVTNLTAEPNGTVTLYAQWAGHIYTVKYNGNGSTSGSTTSSTHTYGTSQKLTANGFSRTGYGFKSWNTKADGSGTSYADNASVLNLTTTNNGTVNLYAQWKAEEYTITYNLDGGAISAGILTLWCDDGSVTPCTSCDNGYVTEWCSGGSVTTCGTCNGSGTCPGSLQLAITSTTTHDCGGTYEEDEYQCYTCGIANYVGSCSSCGYSESTDNHTNASCPDCYGDRYEYNYCSHWELDGHYYDENCYNCDGDTELENYCSHYKLAGHSYTTTCTTCGGDGIEDYNYSPCEHGNTIAHYYCSTHSYNGASSSHTHCEHGYIAAHDGSDTCDGTGYTCYTSEYCKGYIDKQRNCTGGCDGAGINPTTYKPTSSAITLQNPTKTGYTFAGWTGTGLSSATTTVTIPTGSTGDRTYTATWTAKTGTSYKVEHWKQNLTGAETQNATNYTIAETENLAGTTGASVTPAVKTYEGFTSPSSQTATIAADGSLVVKYYYTRNSYTITFNTDGGSAVSSITAKYGAAITAPTDPTKTGYTFTGWDKTIPTTMPAENMTITAQWVLTTYTVTFNANGGLIEETGATETTRTVEKGKTYGEGSDVLPTAKSSVATFTGWYTAATGGTEVTNETVVDETANGLTLYAHWEIINVAIYSETDNSLTFLKPTEVFNEGETYNGKVATAVYTGFETDTYAAVTEVPWYSNRSNVLSVSFETTTTPVSTKYWFYEFRNATSINVNNLVTDNVTNMWSMFFGCSALTSLDLTNFNTSNVVDTSSMFGDCTKLTSLNVTSFDMSNVIYMSSMFFGCQSLTTLDVSNFVTTNAKNMSSMFYSCTKITALDLTSFDTSNVTTMEYMFAECNSLTSLLLNFNTSKVENMNEMFRNCNELEALDLMTFDTTSVTSMTGMFNSCVLLQEVKLGPNFAFVGTDGYLPTPSSSYITGADGNWHNLETDEAYAPSEIPNNTAATYIAIPKVAYAVYSADDTSLTFYKTRDTITAGSTYNGKTATAVYKGFETATYSAASSVPWHDYRNSITTVTVKDEITPVSTAFWFYSFPNATTIDVAKLNTANVTTMRNMFNNCKNVTTLDVSGFDTENVTDMYGVFTYCNNLTYVDVSNWKTGKVTGMRGMFNYCYNLTNLDVSGFDTSLVTEMQYMFTSCRNITSLDLSGFNMSKVTSATSMFDGCYRLQEVTLGSNFKFVDSAYFPTPDSSYITGADGKWYNVSTGTGYAPSEIPSNTVATYTAISMDDGKITATYNSNGGSFTSGTQNVVKYELVEGTLTKTSKTPNVSEDGSSYDSTGYGDNQALVDTITIPGATSLTVTITYATESTTYDWVCVYDGSVTPTSSNYSSSISGKLGGTTQTTKTYTITGDTVQFILVSDGSVSGYYGYYAEISYSGLVKNIASGAYEDPTRSGYTLLGWSTSSSSATAEYAVGEDYMPEESKTLYAVWGVTCTTCSGAGKVTKTCTDGYSDPCETCDGDGGWGGGNGLINVNYNNVATCSCGATGTYMTANCETCGKLVRGTFVHCGSAVVSHIYSCGPEDHWTDCTDCGATGGTFIACEHGSYEDHDYEEECTGCGGDGVI